MGITDIKDEHKRWFALGFKALFDAQSELNQVGVAMAAGVTAPTISAIMRGNEEKFIGFKKQGRIANVFGYQLHEVVAIGKAVENGEDISILLAEKCKSEGQKEETKTIGDAVPEPVRGLAELIKNNIIELSEISQERLWDVAKYVHELIIHEKEMMLNGVTKERRVQDRRSSSNDTGTCPVNDRRRTPDRRGNPKALNGENG